MKSSLEFKKNPLVLESILNDLKNNQQNWIIKPHNVGWSQSISIKHKERNINFSISFTISDINDFKIHNDIDITYGNIDDMRIDYFMYTFFFNELFDISLMNLVIEKNKSLNISINEVSFRGEKE